MPLSSHARTGITLLVFFAAAGAAESPLPPDIFSITDRAAAVSAAEKFRASDDGRKAGPAAIYLSGRAYEMDGDLAAAAGRYSASFEDDSPVGTYSLWRLAKIMRRSGNLPAERLFLLEAATAKEETAAATASAERLVESHFESGDDDEVVRLIEYGPFNTENSGDGPARSTVVLYGKALLGLGRVEQARKAFTEALNFTTDSSRPDDTALEAVEGLDLIDTEYDPKEADIDAETHFLRGEVYQYNRRFREARVHFKSIFDRHKDSDLVPAAVFEIGMGYSRDRDYHSSIEWFERLQGEHPDSSYASDALYQTANSYANVVKPKEASSRFEKYIDEHPESDKRTGAFLNLIDLYRDEGEPGEALKWVERTRLAFPGNQTATIAGFARARLHMSQNDWVEADSDLNSISELPSPGSAFRIETDFVRGFVSEKLGRPFAAADFYALVPDGFRSYYGWRSTQRLRELRRSEVLGAAISRQYEGYLAGARLELTDANAREIRFNALSALRLAETEKDRRELEGILRSALSHLPEYIVAAPPVKDEKIPSEIVRKALLATPGHAEAARALLGLNIWDEGAAELEIAARKSESGQSESPPAERSMIAELYRRAGLVSRSVAEAEGRWRNIPDDYPLEMVPREELALLFPAPFRDDVLRYSRLEGIDPRFLLALMRQESRFDPDVKSSAAARGLLQFIPETASKIASDIQIGGFVREDLYDPATSIRLGARYVSNLLREFPGQTAAVAAAYNAGDDRIRLWIRRSHSDDPDRYVPEIRYSQTKDYVRKVMANYRAYRFLYDERLMPLASDVDAKGP